MLGWLVARLDGWPGKQLKISQITFGTLNRIISINISIAHRHLFGDHKEWVAWLLACRGRPLRFNHLKFLTRQWMSRVLCVISPCIRTEQFPKTITKYIHRTHTMNKIAKLQEIVKKLSGKLMSMPINNKYHKII